MTAPGGASTRTPPSVDKFNQAVLLVEQLISRIRTEFNNLVNRIDAFIRKVQQELEESFFDSFVEFFTDDIGDGLAEIRRRLEFARAKVDELLGKAEQSVAGSIPVASLFSRAFDLTAKVNQPLTGMYGDMTGSGDIDFWRGPTKVTYEKRVADQQQALTNASDKVEALVAYLGDSATANMTYMADLGGRMAEVHGALTTTAIDLGFVGAGAITQVLGALEHFSEVIGTAVAQVIGYVTALGSRIAEVLNQILALEIERSDLTGLTPDGRWPTPVNS